MKQLIDADPLTHTETWHHYDPLTDKTTVETLQDAGPYLEGNKQLQNDPGYYRKGIKDDLLHVARIPNGVIEKWLMEDGLNVYNRHHWPRVKRKLMDPEYSYLRTAKCNL